MRRRDVKRGSREGMKEGPIERRTLSGQISGENSRIANHATEI
jgi:hypothetical protein